MEYTRMNGLKASDYMYPGEDLAFTELNSFPLVDKVIGEIIALSTNTNALPETQADMYRVTEKSCPKVYELFQTAKTRLDIKKEIPLFIKPDFDFNACAYGGESPFIIIHSSFIKNASDDDLLFILGHELGHIKGNHTVYGFLTAQTISYLAQVPVVGPMLSDGLMIAMYEWKRRQEYSADRAGAIAAGGPEKALLALKTLLGLHEKVKGVNVTIEDLLAQHDAYMDETKNWVSKAVLFSSILFSSHPWTVKRICEMNKWKESGEFEALAARLAE